MDTRILILLGACAFPLYGMCYGAVFVGRQFVRPHLYHLLLFYGYVVGLEMIASLTATRLFAWHVFAVALGAICTNGLLTINAYRRLAELRHCSESSSARYRAAGLYTGVAIAFLSVALTKLATSGAVGWTREDYLVAGFLAVALGMIGEGITALLCPPEEHRTE